MKKEAIIPPVVPVLPPIIKAGCVNKPGCNSKVIYVLPYLRVA